MGRVICFCQQPQLPTRLAGLLGVREVTCADRNLSAIHIESPRVFMRARGLETQLFGLVFVDGSAALPIRLVRSSRGRDRCAGG